MFLLRLVWTVVRALFAKRADLVAENLALRQQLNVLRRKVGRPRLRRRDRIFWLWLAGSIYRCAPKESRGRPVDGVFGMDSARWAASPPLLPWNSFGRVSGLTKRKPRPRSASDLAVFHPEFREDLRHWIRTDRQTALRVLQLVEAVLRDPFEGAGKPEPLRFYLRGCWSRRVTQEQRLVYLVRDDRIDFLQARYHY